MPGHHAAVARLPSAGLPGAARYMPPKRAASDLYSRFRALQDQKWSSRLFFPVKIILSEIFLISCSFPTNFLMLLQNCVTRPAPKGESRKKNLFSELCT